MRVKRINVRAIDFHRNGIGGGTFLRRHLRRGQGRTS